MTPYKISVATNKGESIVFHSDHPPKFSPNFICIAPIGNNKDIFINNNIIETIEVDTE